MIQIVNCFHKIDAFNESELSITFQLIFDGDTLYL